MHKWFHVKVCIQKSFSATVLTPKHTSLLFTQRKLISTSMLNWWIRPMAKDNSLITGDTRRSLVALPPTLILMVSWTNFICSQKLWISPTCLVWFRRAAMVIFFYVYLDFLKKSKTFSIRKLIISYKINNNHIMNHLPHWEKSPKKQSVGVYFW